MKAFEKNIKVKFWKDEYIGKSFSADTETEKILSASHTPRIVLSTAYAMDGIGFIIKNQDLERFLDLHKDSTIAWHNASFDLNVIETAFNRSFHDEILGDKVLDTRILYRLLNIAIKGYTNPRTSLDHCVKQAFDIVLDKNEDIRLTFGDFILEDGSINYGAISKRHYEYAVMDAIATEHLKVSMLKTISKLPTSTNLSHNIQLMGEIALDAIRREGIEVDLEYANNLRNELEAEMEKNNQILLTYGLMRGKGFQQKYETVVKHLGLKLPVTGKSQKVSMKASDLEPYKDMHFVQALLDYLALEHRKDFLRLLTETRVHPRYDSIKNTLRTSCQKPNIQNPPRVGGIREAFIPKEGCVLVDIDYSSIELYALAFICKKLFGFSVLYDKLQEGADVHIYAASKIFDIDDETVTKDQRQIAKICNYGLAANMGIDTFQRHMGNSGVDITKDRAKEVKAGWSKAFPEIPMFWKRAQGRSKFISDTGFIRNHCTYTAFLNTHFQSKVAEGCKIAMYNTYRAGFKTVAFVHDALVVECKKEDADTVLKEVSEIMIESMKMVIPGMDIKVDGEIKKRYSK